MIPIIDWRITHSCDNNCLYCYGSKPVKRLSLTEEAYLLDGIARSQCSIVNITGGEPLLSPERCFNIIRTLVHSGKSVYLSTNGANAIENLDFLCEYVSLLGLPLDGYDGVSNQINGRAENAFSLVQGILEANQQRQKKIKIKVGTVITKKNLSAEHLERMCDLLQGYGISTWRIYEMIPVNRGEANRAELELDAREREALCEIVETLRSRAPQMNIELATRSMRNSAYFIIQPDGSVILPADSDHQASEIEVGHLLHETMDEVYEKWQAIANADRSAAYRQTRKDDVLAQQRGG